MTAAVMKTVSFAKPAFGKPSEATLRKIEMLLTLTLVAQVVGLTLRYAM